MDTLSTGFVFLQSGHSTERRDRTASGVQALDIKAQDLRAATMFSTAFWLDEQVEKRTLFSTGTK